MIGRTLTDKAQASFPAPNVGPDGVTLTFELTVTDTLGGLSVSDECTVTVSWFPQRPTADAGDDQSVDEGDLVTLDGSGSDDPDISDGDSITYAWQQTGGPDVGTITGADQAQASFEAPNVGPGGAVLTFELTVTDGGGLFHSDECIVNVGFVSEMPVANAGDDQTVDEGATVTLDGSGSDDPDIPDGDNITYQWTQTAGTPSVTLSDPTAQQPTFVARPVEAPGATLTFELTVEDTTVQIDTDSVDIEIQDNGIEGFPAHCITTTCSTGDPVGLLCSAHFVGVDTSTDPATLPDEGKPDDLMYGLIGTQIKCDNAEDTVTLTMIFLDPVPEDYTVFKYGYRFDDTALPPQCEANESWYDFKDYVSYNGDRTEVTLALTDGGAGDHNCAPDRTIVNPAGIAAAPAVEPLGPAPPANPYGGGGGCFSCLIETSLFEAHVGMNALVIAGLILAVALGAYWALRRFNTGRTA